MNQHRTVAQNAAHRNDLTWTKTGKRTIAGELYTSTYERLDGVVIGKTWRYEGAPWKIIVNGEIVGREHSLTYAKYAAEGVTA